MYGIIIAAYFDPKTHKITIVMYNDISLCLRITKPCSMHLMLFEDSQISEVLKILVRGVNRHSWKKIKALSRQQYFTANAAGAKTIESVKKYRNFINSIINETLLPLSALKDMITNLNLICTKKTAIVDPITHNINIKNA